MTTNIELVRDHDGEISIRVAGVPAHGAKVANMQAIDGKLTAVVFVPLDCATFAETDNVVQFRKAG